MIIYYSICCLLAFLTFGASKYRLLKLTSAGIGASFLALVAGQTIWRDLGMIAQVWIILAGVMFIAGIVKHQGLTNSEKTLFILYATVIIIKVCFTVLGLNRANEMSLLCLGIIAIAGLWVLYKKFIGGSLTGKMDIIEVAGLFACFVFPMLIPLFR